MIWGRDENEDLFTFIKNVIICYFHHFCWSNRNVSIIRHTFLRLYAFWKFRNLENNFNHNLFKRICQRRDIPWLKKYWKHVEELVYQKIKIGYLEYIFNFPYWLILHIITANFFHKIGHQFVWKWFLFLLNYSHIRVRYYVKILSYPLRKSFVFRRCIWRK